MTEQELRLKIVNCAKSFFGAVQGDQRHEIIVDTYNSFVPHPRGYTLKSTDAWCAAFASAIFLLCDMQSLFPVECSCREQIKGWQKRGGWEEDDAYRPNIGDIIYYDWGDNGEGDNTGVPDHVGIVIWTCGQDVLVCEGNKGAAKYVGYREMNLNGRYIRGYGLPDYASIAEAAPVSHYEPNNGNCFIELPILSYGKKGNAVRALQALLNAHGAKLTIDGSFGPATKAAVRQYQKTNDLTIDGSVGQQTWGRLIRGTA